MAGFTALITTPNLLPEAQQILRAAGGRIEFMAEPVLDAVVLRGSKPFIAAVLGAARGLKIIAKNGAGVDTASTWPRPSAAASRWRWSPAPTLAQWPSMRWP